MYFFDIADYYNRDSGTIAFSGNSEVWYNYGLSPNQVGCGGGNGFFLEDYLTTYRETRNAWLKALNEIFLSINARPTAVEDEIITGPLVDEGCVPDFKAAYVLAQYKVVDWVKASIELTKTYRLCRYFYDYGKTLNWQNIPATNPIFQNDGLDPVQAWGGTYEQYKDYLLNTYQTGGYYSTGTSTTSWTILNPYLSNTKSAITFTVNFGTSFEIADLTQKVNNYDNAMKDMMCKVKDLIVLAQGEIMDAFDANGNFDGELFKDYNIY